jgi:hypothetical protein
LGYSVANVLEKGYLKKFCSLMLNATRTMWERSLGIAPKHFNVGESNFMLQGATSALLEITILLFAKNAH